MLDGESFHALANKPHELTLRSDHKFLFVCGLSWDWNKESDQLQDKSWRQQWQPTTER
jgi:hypothetical protein